MSVTIDQVRKVISSQLCVSEDTITPGCNLVTTLQIDSLDAVEIVMALENEFNLKAGDITDDLLSDYKTLQEIADFINITF